MLVEEELSKLRPDRETLLTIGVFDGVHLGHRHLIDALVQRAALRNLTAGVVTFYRHPRLVLSPHIGIPQLTTFEERVELIKACGAGLVAALTFTPELATVSARDFVTLLQKHLKMRGLVVGPNFALGRWREGNIDRLKDLGQELGFTVETVLPLIMEGSIVSSTAIREAIAGGEMSMVARLLGRHYGLTGTVVGGNERGQTLGFRTANISVAPERALPPDGVYATICHIAGVVYLSVTNIGTRPTFGGGDRSIEVHVLDFSGDIYGQTLSIGIVERLRPEIKFESPERLVAQIKKDVHQARQILKPLLSEQYVR